MTNKERLTVLFVFVSILGFSFIFALKPVTICYKYSDETEKLVNSIEKENINVEKYYYSESQERESKMVNMLSEVLEIEGEDVLIALEGGLKPSELLLTSGILLADLQHLYSFDLVGNGLVKFRS
jgi:hypothetical protein